MKNNYFNKKEKITRLTIPVRVSNTLRKLILKGELIGGMALKQEALATQFQVSMSALREALKTLESEGLVQFNPNRGVVVSALSAEEAQEIFEIRMLLEVGALGYAIPQLTERDLLKAECILNQLEQEKDSSKWSELNYLFHETLYQASGRKRLLEMIQVLHNNVERYMNLYLEAMHFQEQSQIEHRTLLEACCQKNMRKAKSVLQGHMGAASKMLTKYLLTKEEEKSHDNK